MSKDRSAQNKRFKCSKCHTILSPCERNTRQNITIEDSTGNDDSLVFLCKDSLNAPTEAEQEQASAALYCTSCDEITCKDCTSFGNFHHGSCHNILYLEEYYNLQIDKVKAALAKVLQSLDEHRKMSELFTVFAQDVAKHAKSYISLLNRKFNELVNIIEETKANLVVATMHHAQILQAKATSSQSRRKQDKINKQFKQHRITLEQLAAATLNDENYKCQVAKYFSCKQVTPGNLKVDTPSSIDLPAELKEIVKNELRPVRRQCSVALKVAKLFVSFSESYNRLMVIGGYLDNGSSIYDFVEGCWYSTAPMNNKRFYSAAVNWNGTVVVAGGDFPKTASVEQFNPKTNKWTALCNLQVARCCHALVNIGGNLYAIGGENDHEFLSSVEKYDKTSNTWKIVLSLKKARTNLACAAYKGRAIVIGGYSGGNQVQSTCELLDSVGMRTEMANSLEFPRMYHAAAAHADMVFVFGGTDRSDLKSEFSCVAEVEQYNWNANKWTVLQARLRFPRFELAAACIDDLIYVVGGSHDKEYSQLDVVECFDTDTKQINTAAPLPMANRTMAAVCVNIVALPKNENHENDSRRCQARSASKTAKKQMLLCIGGFSNKGDSTAVKAYDCNTEQWLPVAPTKNKHCYAAAVSMNGKVIIAGGNFPMTDSMEQYDPKTNTWTDLTNLPKARCNHALVTLHDGLYVIGGSLDGEEYLSSVERFDTEGNWTSVAELCMARKKLACATCEKGIVATGGEKDNNTLTSCELYNTTRSQWFPIATLNTARSKHAAAAHKHRVYVFGGWCQNLHRAEIEQYDVDANKWTLLITKLSQARSELAAASVYSRIYILGGSSNVTNQDDKEIDSETDTVDTFDPEKAVFSSALKLPDAVRAHAVVAYSVVG